MDLRTLRRQCEMRLRELPLPDPFDLATFCEVVAQRRGRPILLQPIVAASGPYGVWVAGPSLDVIFYEQGTSPLHQDHIVLHEVCHLICEHRPVPLSDADIAALLCPHLEATSIARVLQRASYSSADECEAELLASLIVERTAGGLAERKAAVVDRATESVLRRLEASLEREELG